jgi:hypothetical protein
MTGFLQLTKIWKSHRVCEDRVLSESIFTFIYAGSSIQNASEQFASGVHISFVNFALHPTPRTSNTSETREGRTARARFKHLYLGNHSELDTCSYELFDPNDRYYEGRLISNARSEISGKRDHGFKQTKVGSKVQYFSYKLTYLLFDIVALSFNTFFPT